MSKNEILRELASLSPEDRNEIRARLNELDGVADDDWDDDGELTEEQKRMILARIEEHERNPETAIPWEQAEAELKRLFP
jgi:putative addiction module component (TIGR02574 family)